MPRWSRPHPILCALVLPWLAASCRDATAPRRTARLDVAGAPTGPMLVGATAQLLATAEDAKGDTLLDRVLTWTSSDARVATVNATGLVTGVSAGTAMVRVSTDGQTDSIPVDVRLGAVIGFAGGRVAMASDSVAVVVPPKALLQATAVTLRAVAPAANSRLVGASAYELAPSTLAFAKAATMTLTYDRTRIPAGVSQRDLVLATLNGTTWVPVLGTVVDTSAGTVRGPIWHGGTFATTWTSIAEVSITGASSPDTLYAGEAVRLAAVPFDSTSDPLPPRPTTWSSSDPSVATVDGSGQVSAAGAGTATITATVEGHAASFSIVVIPGLVVDWSHATDWTTFQGDASHAGFIAATMNPRRFHELWSTIPFAHQPLRAAAVADSTVVVTSAAGSDASRVALFDLATGTPRWHYDPGAVTSVSPPTYVGGTVFVATNGPDSLRLWSFAGSSGVIRFRKAFDPAAAYVAPLLIGQSVYATSDSGLYAFDAASGAKRWFTSTAAAQTGAMLGLAARGGSLYVWQGVGTGGVTAVDTTGVVAYAIPDPGTNADYYTASTQFPVLGGANDLLVTNGGRLLSFDLVGRTIAWQVAGNFGLTPAVAGGVIFAENSGRVEARSESDGSLLWTFTPPDGEPVAFPCVVSNNLLFASTGTTTYAVDLASHASVWQHQPGGALAVSARGVLVISSPSDGGLTAIALR